MKVRPMIIMLSQPMEVSFGMKAFYLKKTVYVPKNSIRELLVKETCEGGLMGHFSVHKIYEAFCEHFY
ncbi:hypothetical protein CR513_33185, partial [Mucuna pruriens]